MATKSEGFETADGYAAVPWGKRLVIIHNGQQLEDVSTVRQANTFIKKHREDNPMGVIKFSK
jgi:ABC-type uncharacterized transport system ATPase component